MLKVLKEMLSFIKAFYFTACNPSCSAQTVKKVHGSVFSTLLKRYYNKKKKKKIFHLSPWHISCLFLPSNETHAVFLASGESIIWKREKLAFRSQTSFFKEKGTPFPSSLVVKNSHLKFYCCTKICKLSVTAMQ